MLLHIPLNRELVAIKITEVEFGEARSGGIEVLAQIAVENIVAWELARRQFIPLPETLYGQKPQIVIQRLKKTAKYLTGKWYENRITAAHRRLSDYTSLRMALYRMGVYSPQQLLAPPSAKNI